MEKVDDLVGSAIIESFLYQTSPLLFPECDQILVVIPLSLPSNKDRLSLLMPIVVFVRLS